ncbi:MAG: tRNA (guanosine(46)-N7)-methyltransferase TrmB [Hyphomicrobiaceae bacterium]|nr:tRNA (guanosine(46)-N7)-methyltransferase TrmB [Hyphomicrobiaceae bacterium]
MSTNEPQRRRQVHGRIKGGKLSPRKQILCDELLPRLRITPCQPDSLTPLKLFSADSQKVWLEIGFGGGEHLAWQAAQNPDIGFIGCEPFLNGVAKLLVFIDEQGLPNIRIRDDDAVDILEALAPNSIDRLFILHPDPWPKKRHHKRRFISRINLDLMAKVLKPGAELRFASDIPHYVAWTLKHMAPRTDFIWTARSAKDWRSRPADWPATRYGQKALREGRPPAHLTFVRK